MSEPNEPATDPAAEPPARTAGEQDHENIDTFRGAEADPPEDTGRPEDAE